MSTLLDHLRSQIFRSSAVGEPPSIFVEEVTPPEIGQLNRIVGVQKNVFRLDISMDNWRIVVMQVLDRRDDLSKVLGCLLLIEPAFSLEHGVELPSGAVLEDKVEIVFIFIVVV
jgi:hypothetical protein